VKRPAQLNAIPPSNTDARVLDTGNKRVLCLMSSQWWLLRRLLMQ